jgi:hypothetical protein
MVDKSTKVGMKLSETVVIYFRRVATPNSKLMVLLMAKNG